MRLWAEERKSGTIELFLTLPIRMTEAVVGKFLAAWGFAGIALALTFPFWITVNFLGSPDNGVILASYIGSWLMAGAFLAIGAGALGGDQEPGDRLRRHRGASSSSSPSAARRWCWASSGLGARSG